MSASTTSISQPPGPVEPANLGIDQPTLELLRGAAEKHGPVVRFVSASGKSSVYVEDPELAQKLLVRKHSQSSKGRGFERVKMLLGNGLIVSDGDHWRRSRTMIQPAFKPRSIERMAERMLQHSKMMAADWSRAAETGAGIDLAEATTQFGLGVIVDCIFGDDVDARNAAAPDSRFAFLRPDAARDLSMVQAARALRQWITGVVERRMQSAESWEDFLGLYLDARDKNDQPFSERELLDEMITLIVAGFETTANTLTWVWYELARNPEIAEAVCDELIASGAPDQVSLESVDQLPLTLQVLQETLRLYPPVWLYTRRANEDIDLGDFRLSEGEQIYLSPYLTQRSSRYWESPSQFMPTRFEDAGQKAHGLAFFPFSLGPRRCVGEHFSYLEMKIQLANTLPLLMPTLDRPEHKPECEFAINLRSRDPIYLTLTTRENLPQ